MYPFIHLGHSAIDMGKGWTTTISWQTLSKGSLPVHSSNKTQEKYIDLLKYNGHDYILHIYDLESTSAIFSIARIL